MATRAVYSFTGFPEQPQAQPSFHLYLHHDGYPTGAAWRFATAWRHCGSAAGFLEAFRQTQSGAVALAGPSDAADAEYRYGVGLSLAPADDGEHGITVRCWRRLPATGIWHPRCEPVPLVSFIQRFLPGDPL
jgi:hypothetical protein